jgi:hypothetical protein
MVLSVFNSTASNLMTQTMNAFTAETKITTMSTLQHAIAVKKVI